MQNELPEWAVEQATELADEVFDACVDDYEGHDGADFTAMIARALLAAERRGIERAAEECDRFAKTGHRLWAEDETDRAELHLAQAYGAQSCATAIRQLGEEP